MHCLKSLRTLLFLRDDIGIFPKDWLEEWWRSSRAIFLHATCEDELQHGSSPAAYVYPGALSYSSLGALLHQTIAACMNAKLLQLPFSAAGCAVHVARTAV